MYSPSFESWANGPKDFSATYFAFENAILAERLVVDRGDLDGAYRAVAKAQDFASRAGPEARAAAQEAADFVAQNASSAASAASSAAAADAAYVAGLDNSPAALERERLSRELDAAAQAAVDRGENPNVAYGLGLAGQAAGAVGAAASGALAAAIGGWAPILGLGLAVVAVGVGAYVWVVRK